MKQLKQKINIVILFSTFFSLAQFAVAMDGYNIGKRSTKLHDRLMPNFSNNGRKEFIRYQLLCNDNKPDRSPYGAILAEVCFKIPVEDAGDNLFVYRNEKPYVDRSIKDIKLALPNRSKNVYAMNKPKIYKTLNAGNINDDFYLSIMDSSPQNLLAVAREENIYLLDPQSPQPIILDVNALCQDNIEFEDNLTSVHFVGNGRYLVAGTEAGTLCVWDLINNKKIIRKIDAHSGRIGVITSLAPDSCIIFTGSHDQDIHQFDLTKNKPLLATYAQYTNRKAEGHTAEVCGLAVDPTGNFLVSGGNDDEVFIWDLKTPSEDDNYTVFQLENAHEAAVKAIAWHPDGQYFATGGGTADRQIKLWDIKTKRAILAIKTGSQVSSLNWAGNRLFSTHGFSANNIQTWIVNFDDSTIEKEYNCNNREGRIFTATFLNKKQTLVTLGADQTLVFWDISLTGNNKHDLDEKSSLLYCPTIR